VVTVAVYRSPLIMPTPRSNKNAMYLVSHALKKQRCAGKLSNQGQPVEYTGMEEETHGSLV
jgi:hypothetical protein